MHLCDGIFFMQLYAKEVLVGGVDDVFKLAEQGDLKAQLALAVGVDTSARKTPAAAAAAGDGKSVQERCKELIKRSVSCLCPKLAEITASCRQMCYPPKRLVFNSSKNAKVSWC